MKKYWQAFKINLQRHLTYRVRIIIWAFNDSISFVIFPFIWLAIYGSRDIVSGYTRVDIITYYIVMAFISVAVDSHSINAIKTDIMEGGLSSILTKPINYIWFRTMGEISYKMLSAVIVVFALVIFKLVFSSLLIFPHSVILFLLFIFSLLISFIISHLFQLIIGLGTLWLGQTGALQSVRQVVESVFSGVIAPLSFFPFFLQVIANYLPFRFQAYFPAQIFLGQINIWQIGWGFIWAFGWIFILLLVVIFMWKRGIKQYEGVGI